MITVLSSAMTVMIVAMTGATIGATVGVVVGLRRLSIVILTVMFV